MNSIGIAERTHRPKEVLNELFRVDQTLADVASQIRAMRDTILQTLSGIATPDLSSLCNFECEDLVNSLSERSQPLQCSPGHVFPEVLFHPARERLEPFPVFRRLAMLLRSRSGGTLLLGR